MKPSDYTRLEKDYSFKRTYFNTTPWWRTLLLVPPVALIFTGLAGITYLLNIEKLASLYAIPYLVVFIAGTIWLKAIRKHIQKTALSDPASFLMCAAASVGEKDGYAYLVFSNSDKRHNAYYTSNLAASLSVDELAENKEARKKTVHIHDQSSDTSYCLRAYRVRDITKRNGTWIAEPILPLLYINDTYTLVVRRRDW